MPSELEAMSVLDEKSGKTLEFRNLHSHPKYRDVWSTSYANELGRIFQGIVSGNAGPKQQEVKRTNTFMDISYEDIPLEK